MARNGEESNQLDEQTKMVLRVRELFRGRFTIDEIDKLLRLHSYEQGPTVFYILSSDTQEIRKVLTDNSNFVERLSYVRNDNELVEDAKRNLIGFCVRQFTCCKCDRMWWWKAPKRKPVSRCKYCQVKYDPVPEEVEFGWGEFQCRNCGNIFKGHGQKTTTRSECYNCHSLCFPVEIEPPVIKRKIRGRGAKNFHSCDAPDCYNQIEENSKEKTVRGPSGLLKKCVHPLSISGDRRFATYYPCEIHKSTGSTVKTFISQDYMSYSRSECPQNLETINEDLDGITLDTDRLSMEDKLDKRLKEANGTSLSSTTLPPKSNSSPLSVKSPQNANLSIIRNPKESADNGRLQHLSKDGEKEDIKEADGAPN